jgi:plastocyanin
MIRRLWLAVGLLSVAAAAGARPLTVHVADGSGHPVVNAVIVVRAVGQPARAPVVRGPYLMSQRDLQFHPPVLLVPVGADVSFPNFDSTKHHVYSFSTTKKFELKLFAKEQSRSVHFDKAGVVPLGCNIHDQMSASVFVADSYWTAKTDARGLVQFPDAPDGAVILTLWHPYLRVPGNSVDRPLAPSERSVDFVVRLRPPPVQGMSGY